MPIPNREYTPGEVDPVLKRVVPAEPPAVEDYPVAGTPTNLVIDIVLHLRSQGNPAALDYDLEAAYDASTGELEVTSLVDALDRISDNVDTIPKLEFSEAMINGLAAWTARRLPPGMRAMLNGEYVGVTAEDVAAEGGNPDLADFDLEIDDLKTKGPERRKVYREQLRAQIAKHAEAERPGVIGRIRTPRPAPDPASLRVEPDQEERAALTRSMDDVLGVVRRAIEQCSSDDANEIRAGLLNLDATAAGLRLLHEDVTAVLAEPEFTLDPITAAQHRRAFWINELLGQTEDLRQVLDPSVLDDEMYVAFINRLNVRFVADMLHDHEEFCRTQHQEHEAGNCHVKDNGYRMLRPVYQRIVSTDPEVDNALPGLEELSGVMLDAAEECVLPYVITLHAAMTAPIEASVTESIKRDRGRSFSNLLQTWGTANLDFMALMNVKPVQEILSEQDEQDLIGEIPPNAAMGAALSIRPGVFIPRRESLRAALDDVLAMRADDTDAELFIPEDWNGGTE